MERYNVITVHDNTIVGVIRRKVCPEVGTYITVKGERYWIAQVHLPTVAGCEQDLLVECALDCS